MHVTITSLVNERNVITCYIRPAAYGIHPQISGKSISFDLDQPRYLVIFFNEEPTFQSPGLLLFAEPEEKNPPKLGDANVVNIMDYKVDNTGKTLETATINRAITDVSARPGGGVLFFPAGVYLSGEIVMQSNVKLYVDAGALIRGSRKNADYVSPPMPAGGAAAARDGGLQQRGECRPRGARRHRHGGLPVAVARLRARHRRRQGALGRGAGQRSARRRQGLHRQPLQEHLVPGAVAAALGLLDDHRQRHRKLLRHQHQDRQPQAAVPRRRLRLHRQQQAHPRRGQLRHDHGRHLRLLWRQELHGGGRGDQGTS